MLGWIAATTGGLIKDTQVALGNAWDVLSDEVTSIPDAFSTGYEHGLFTGPDLSDEEHDHHVNVEETIAEKHGGKRFGQA